MLATGIQIGEYALQEKLGEGGFGSVWLVKDNAGNAAALKVLHGRLLKRRHDANIGPSVAERFIAEAELIRRLDFEGFVEIYDVINRPDKGVVAYVMEVLYGSNLAERVTDIPLPSLLRVMSDVAKTLHQLHQNDIIHRDVKASNMFLCEPKAGQTGYQVKLIDFGIAKDISQNALLESTGTGFFIGTVARWTDETVGAVGPKMDQWSLGITFFYLLSGRMPFQNENLGKLVNDIENGRARPLLLQSRFQFDAVPSDIENLVSKTLSIRPENRFSDMAELSLAFLKLSEKYAARVPESQELDFQATIMNLYQSQSPERMKTPLMLSTISDTTLPPQSELSDTRPPIGPKTLALSKQRSNFPSHQHDTVTSFPPVPEMASLSRKTPELEPSTEPQPNPPSELEEDTDLATNDNRIQVKRGRVIVTAEGGTIPLASPDAQKAQLEAEALAKTHVTKIEFPPPDTIIVTDKSKSSGRLGIPRILIGVICVLAGFLSYLFVWWVRHNFQ